VSRSEKKARRKVQVSEDRTPRVARGARPQPDRTPRRARTFTPPDPTGKVVVQFGWFDTGSTWCLTKITPDDHRALLERIRGIEAMTVAQVFSSNGEPGKDYSLENGLPNADATERLIELGYDDQDRISRLRVSGTGRLYGFRRGERFYALWWDPDHLIWPSQKKHT
jgi:hypothetical protein